jgi:hypothetical protein
MEKHRPFLRKELKAAARAQGHIPLEFGAGLYCSCGIAPGTRQGCDAEHCLKHAGQIRSCKFRSMSVW